MPSYARLVQVLTASDAGDGDYFGMLFGSRSAVDGEVAAIGAFAADNSAGVDAGSVYLFTLDGPDWVELQPFNASDTAAGDWFGGRTLVSGDMIVVTASEHDLPAADAGSAYVFWYHDSTLSEGQKLLGGHPAENDGFGWAMAAHGDTLVISSTNWGETDASGSVDVFTRTGDIWNFHQHLTASDSAPRDVFGQYIEVTADELVVTAPSADISGFPDAGAAYVFKKMGETWVEHQKITAADPEAFDMFGTCVSISGDTMLISAQYDEPDEGLDSGSVYVFRRAGDFWTEETKLTAPDGGTGDWFGDSQFISGDTAVISACNHDHSSLEDAGAVYVFTRSGDTWFEREKITAPDAAAGDQFGWGLAASEEFLLVGAPLNDHSGFTDAGCVYLYQLPGFAASFESGNTSDWSVTASH
jgi:hypothetical protein